MNRRTKQLRGSLRSLIKEIGKEDEVIGDLLEATIQKTAEAISIQKDTKRVSDHIEAKIDQIYEYRDRYE